VVYPMVNIFELICWVALIIVVYVVLVKEIISSSYFREFFSLLLFIVSVGIISFLMFIHSYTGFEYVIVIICWVAVVSVPTMLEFYFKIKLKLFHLVFIGISFGFLVVCIMIYFNAIFFLVLINSFITLLISVVVMFSSVKYRIPRKSSRSRIKKYFKIGLILVPIISVSFLFLTVKHVVISPTTKPDIYFWSPTGNLPRSNTTLPYCARHDIGFVVPIRESYIDDGGASEARRIQYLIDYEVSFYICIGGEDFFATMDNADEFYSDYKTIKYWMMNWSIYYTDYFKGFMLDAEPSKENVDTLEGKGTMDKTEYFIDGIPSKKENEDAEKSLTNFIKAANDDGKDVGLIKMTSWYDEFDDDGDYSQLMRNIYHLDLPWEFSITMVYRTKHIPFLYDYIIRDVGSYDYANEYTDPDYEVEYLEESQEERNVQPISEFFSDVGYAVKSSDVNVPENKRYIFIGVFHRKFRDTTYIKEKQYKKDLSICQHFGVEKVFIYQWSSFKSRYGVGELKELRVYRDTKNKWVLILPSYVFGREIGLDLLYITMDSLIFIYN